MIKINLLDSVTERQGGASSAVEKKVSNPMSRFLLMSIAVFTLLLAVVGWDFISTYQAKSEAERQLVEQKKKAEELATVMKEQQELEQKIDNIDKRIDAIKKLRNSQAGPSAVLESIRERIGMTPDIYLDSVEQKGDQLTVKGSSPNETSITQFGRSLEFSSGLFTNLSIETQRKEVQSQQVNDVTGVETPALEVIEFTIRCAYTPENAGKDKDSTTASNESGDDKKEDSGSEDAPKVAQNNSN